MNKNIIIRLKSFSKNFNQNIIGLYYFKWYPSDLNNLDSVIRNKILVYIFLFKKYTKENK